MRKYIAIFKNSFQSILVYRFNVFTNFISYFFTLGIFLYLWISIYRQGGQVGSYDLVQLIIYYVTTSFLNTAIKGIDVAKNIGESIRQGTITNLLLKPINHFGYYVFSTIAQLTYQILASLALFLILGIILAIRFGFVINFSHFFYFILAAFLGFLINFLIFYIIGTTTFWLGFVMGFNYVTQVIIGFLDGSFIPLDLLPPYITQINNFLPFKYIIFTPISIFIGRLQPDIWVFIIPFLWIIVLYFISRILFRAGLKKYEGFGI